MLKYEKIQLKEALIISYTKDNNKGKMVLKKEYSNFLYLKQEALATLNWQGFTIDCQDILYYSDEDLQEYLK